MARKGRYVNNSKEAKGALSAIKESPEARKERLARGNRAVSTRVPMGMHKGSRSGNRSRAINEQR